MRNVYACAVTVLRPQEALLTAALLTAALLTVALLTMPLPTAALLTTAPLTVAACGEGDQGPHEAPDDDAVLRVVLGDHGATDLLPQ